MLQCNRTNVVNLQVNTAKRESELQSVDAYCALHSQ